jgi:hypothetical protein
MDAPTRMALEALYSVLLSAVVQLARALGKPCPVITRADRRAERVSLRDY